MCAGMPNIVGNQLPILLIDFKIMQALKDMGWESVTNPLDRLPPVEEPF